MRAISVFLVILYHYGFERVPGPHGVLMFFLLSGFLITWLLLKENEKTGTISLKAFYERRVRRIFPAFYFYWFVVMAYLLATRKPMPWGNAWSSFFFFSNYYSGLTGHPANAFSQMWSLGIEQQFYLLWPMAFLLLRRDLARMTAWVMLASVAVWAYRAVLVLGFGVGVSYLYSAFDARCDHLLVGCLLAVVLKRGIWKRLWRFALCHPLMPLLTIGALVFSIEVGNAQIPRYRDLIGFAVDPLLFALLLVQMVVFSEGRWWGWVDSAPMRFLGLISYPLYLWQQMTLFTVRRVLAGYPEAIRFAGAAGVTIVVASISYYLVERRFLKRARGGHEAPTPARVESEVTAGT